MDVVTLHEVEEALRQIDPETLREMVYQTAHSHITVCRLTSQVGDCSHIGSDQTRDRVAGLGLAELVEILAPAAWIAVDIHHRIGD